MDGSTNAPSENREKTIIKTGLIGITANVFLSAVKAAVGIISNSIAVILDAVNNLSDALSSIITIIGAKISGKKPDSKHPLGHGRIEYISTLVVAALVLYAGITSGVESVKKIITPEEPDYSFFSLIIIALAVIMKLTLGLYVKKTGKRVNSGSLTASGSDALFDAVISLSVLISALIFKFTGVSLEAYLGVAISALIIKSGVGMLIETVDEILGRQPGKDYTDKIKETICDNKNVFGAFDLILHSYGPEKYIGSVHVEIPDYLTAGEIDQLQRKIASDVYRKHGVLLTGVGIYSINTGDSEIKELHRGITGLVTSHKGVLQIHGFFADKTNKTVNLDIILDFSLKNREEEFAAIKQELEKAYPEWTFNLTMDIDV
ncbi:MAG: cation transporter [Clostridia bacterium]|nr:cation transporter [Clostridia bacterium]